MEIVQLTPGAGPMFCGNCLRDNALTASLRRLGHQVTMIPLYLPLTLDEPNQSAGMRIFFGGVNVFLEQQLPWFRHAPAWLHRQFSRPGLLGWAAGRAARTQPGQVGDLTLSMLRGERGNQERELRELIAWLKIQPAPDFVCLSNVLLAGMARCLRAELHTRIVCNLQGEDSFLDALPPGVRELCWKTIAECAPAIDCFIAPSGYFAETMMSRLNLPRSRARVVPNGIELEGYPPSLPAARPESAPVLGFFARMCREKGLDLLVDAFIRIRRGGRFPNLRLKVGGSCGPNDERFVKIQRSKLRDCGLLRATEFHPNVSRAGKIDFLKSLTVFSVPSVYGEAFGLYVLEAMAAGVPVVQPRAAAFPELVEATGGGMLCEPANPGALAESIELMLADEPRRMALGAAGHRSVWSRYSAQAMAARTESLFNELARVCPKTGEI